MKDFWLDCDIEGRKTMLSGGPRRKGGNLKAELYVKEEGCSKCAVILDCFTNEEGKLQINIINKFTGKTNNIVVEEK